MGRQPNCTPSGRDVWEGRLGGTFGRDVWEGRLGGTFGWDVWVGRLGGTFGRDVWEGRLGGTFGRDVWEERLGGTFGRDVWVGRRARPRPQERGPHMCALRQAAGHTPSIWEGTERGTPWACPAARSCALSPLAPSQASLAAVDRSAGKEAHASWADPNPHQLPQKRWAPLRLKRALAAIADRPTAVVLTANRRQSISILKPSPECQRKTLIPQGQSCRHTPTVERALDAEKLALIHLSARHVPTPCSCQRSGGRRLIGAVPCSTPGSPPCRYADIAVGHTPTEGRLTGP